MFLQAFDEGWVTDGRGKRVYLSDAIIIMTSNLGAEHFRKLTSPFGFRTATTSMQRRRVRRDARARAPVPAGVPEPHRRGGVVLAAGAATRCGRSREQHLGRIEETLRERQQDDDRWTTRRSKRSCEEGHSLAYGARFLKRVIDERIKLPISEHWWTKATQLPRAGRWTATCVLETRRAATWWPALAYGT